MVPKGNILAVDDMPANLVALEAVLEPTYNLVLANSGPQAISILQSRQDIDIILMDIQMPGMDGFEATSHIQRIEHCRDIPIIFITAVYREAEFMRKGFDVGAVDYFSKPFDPEILKKKLAIYASFRQKSYLLKERERQISESEEVLKAGRKLASLLESLPVGVLIADVGGRICQANEEVSRIFKAVEPIERDSYGEILGWWESGGQMIKDEHSPLARALYKGETCHNVIIKIRSIDGTPKTLLSSSSPLLGINNHVVGAVVVIQDITETKKIGQDLEQRITKLVSLGIELEQSLKRRPSAAVPE